MASGSRQLDLRPYLVQVCLPRPIVPKPFPVHVPTNPCVPVLAYLHPPSRHSKPFNPLLGETYELVNQEAGYCVVVEQVSHHPPVTALHAESEKWIFWEEYKLDIKFRGQVGTTGSRV